MITYPRICFIGDTGDGKTLSMTALAIYFYQQGYKIYSNYTLFGIEWEYLDPKNIVDEMFSEDSRLHDCVILTDEAHVDFGKFSYFKKSSQEATKFATQSRKRRIIWLYSTQIFTNLVKTLRDLTSYLVYCKPLGNDFYQMDIHDRTAEGFINRIQIDGTLIYDLYDTEEIIDETLEK